MNAVQPRALTYYKTNDRGFASVYLESVTIYGMRLLSMYFLLQPNLN